MTHVSMPSPRSMASLAALSASGPAKEERQSAWEVRWLDAARTVARHLPRRRNSRHQRLVAALAAVVSRRVVLHHAKRMRRLAVEDACGEDQVLGACWTHESSETVGATGTVRAVSKRRKCSMQARHSPRDDAQPCLCQAQARTGAGDAHVRAKGQLEATAERRTVQCGKARERQTLDAAECAPQREEECVDLGGRHALALAQVCPGAESRGHERADDEDASAALCMSAKLLVRHCWSAAGSLTHRREPPRHTPPARPAAAC